MRGTLRQAQDDLFRVLTMTFKVIQDDGFWRLEDGFPTTNLGNDIVGTGMTRRRWIPACAGKNKIRLRKYG